ncbi:hypothetical protein IQ225_14020, partial [Synechocystis salina LEGE 06155]|nr:hypothetical protein [Synechocystis salina LEGE 06155]
MFTKLNRVLLASGLAVGTTALIAPLAMAGGGGVAGSAAFTIDGGAVTDVSTAAAVGHDVSTAWSFNDATTGAEKNSAGAMGASG